MKIGKIISVEYDKFRIKLFQSTKTSTVSIEGQVYYFGNIGSYLKTLNPTGDTIICEVISVLDYNSETNLYSSYNLDSSRELVIKPVGTITKSKDFNMGIGIFPSIYSDVSIVTTDDIKQILSSTKVEPIDENYSRIHKEIELGYSKNMINYRVNLNINRLFNIHTAVLGNSGSGKSNTIAHILQNVYRKKNNYAKGAKTILFDVNGEYNRAFESGLYSDVESIFYKPNVEEGAYKKFELPYYLMNLDEWLAFLLASDRTQKPFWDKVLQESFKFYKILNNLTEDVTETEKFINYIKWKVKNILHNINSQVDSDTSKMTSAKGAIAQIRKTFTEIKKNLDESLSSDLSKFLDKCNDVCGISFGTNNNSLSDALPKFVHNGTVKHVLISQLNQGGYFTTTVEARSNNETFKQIDEAAAIEADNERLKEGDYFDYKFLKTAIDIVLLEEEAKGNSRIREFTSTMLSRLDYFLTNIDNAFLRDIKGSYKNYNDYLKQTFGIGDKTKKQLIIIDTSEIGADALELMTGIVSRMLFDYRKLKTGEDRRKEPIHLILDEAHRYIKKDTDYILKENIFERIAREGRKFSLYLLISSQRPSELSPTVLSQCGNYIIHRIQNEIDMKFVYSVLPYFSENYTIKVKQQVPGEALIFGNCVPMPLHVKVHEAKPAPNSENCDISKEWFDYK
ncbi:MAG: DUF87 domain-containing protein [Marinifilaceae bacterium]|jgi:DNA helicase HerA-like ATPase|nr:DUF87 domain-containing protein [Marinifilaceae bacterium]